jgi:hypothetical protein
MQKTSLRNKAHTRDAQHYPCIRCGREGETRACHYCGYYAHRLGKGRGVKCHDLAVADFCQGCDDLFSEANYPAWEGGSKNAERTAEFLFFILLTIIRRAESGAT